MTDAFHIAAVGNRNDFERAMARAPLAQVPFFRALLAQYSGDVDGAIRLFRRQISLSTGADRAAVADILAPSLVMRHDNAAVIKLAGVMDDAGWRASAHAFRALAYADLGNREAARRHAGAAKAALATERDDVIRARVLQRLARTAFYLNEHEAALDFALHSVKLSTKLGAWRTAAAAYSIAYNIEYGVTGDFAEADRYARLWHHMTLKCDDASFVHQARVAEYELAVAFADAPRIATLERAIKKSLLPQQYNERFPYVLSFSLVRGAVNPIPMRTLLVELEKLPTLSRGERALCSALIGLSEAAENDDVRARRSIALALGRLGRRLSGAPAYEHHYRRVARAIVAATRVLLGDHALAARTMLTHESRHGRGEQHLVAFMQNGSTATVPLVFRGYARVLENARRRRQSVMPPAGLTSAEFEVLRLLNCGWSAGRIASETQRSINTVYNHTRAILTKLDASRSAEAVAIARERGFIT